MSLVKLLEGPNTQIFLICAILAHEGNRNICALEGDLSKLPWDQTPEKDKDITMSSVMAVYENRNITPEEMHEAWMRKKISQGFVYGDGIVPNTHPCLVDYKELSIMHKLKDLAFISTVKNVLSVFGF